ncbi:MAG TPA: aminotransferase class I/II-fold pyridoxal phosphate-dependent enzyme [Acidimicrobiales bacterium]|nr:aminotransferase class I/II-fold pyridoxal phosphate-dependent enzyme [Acidimicrobiales bacterium]
MSFTPPAYPYERLDGLRKRAAVFEGGPIDCSIGTPVDPPPDFVIEELARGVGAKGYPPSAGTLDFRDAAAHWMNRRFALELAPDDLAACVGTKEFVGSLAGYLHLRYPERDTVLYPAVSYPTYAMGATLAALRSVPVALVGGQLDLGSIDSADVARALVLWSNSPSNPTGGLDDLEGLAAWGRHHGVLVVSDECYAEFTWATRPRSILEHGSDGVLALHSLSKRSNLAGFRAGFYAGDAEIVAYLRSVRQHAGLMAPGPVQAAAALAFADDEHVDTQRERYRRRLELLSDALKRLDVDAPFPDGGFYLWCSKEGLEGWGLATMLAERSGLVVSPGELYGEAGASFVRLAVVQPDERLELAASRLEAP